MKDQYNVVTTGNLHNYRTGECIREATKAETLESIIAAESDGGVGAFNGRDGTTCYVTGGIVAFRFGFGGTDAIRGTIEAASLDEAYAALRALMTGGCATTIWVESPSGRRLTMGENAE